MVDWNGRVSLSVGIVPSSIGYSMGVMNSTLQLGGTRPA